MNAWKQQSIIIECSLFLDATPELQFANFKIVSRMLYERSTNALRTLYELFLRTHEVSGVWPSLRDRRRSINRKIPHIHSKPIHHENPSIWISLIPVIHFMCTGMN
jgi:hypothetical protein